MYHQQDFPTIQAYLLPTVQICQLILEYLKNEHFSYREYWKNGHVSALKYWELNNLLVTNTKRTNRFPISKNETKKTNWSKLFDGL